MLTGEENEALTRVGPGTPAGELLRRYWHPVAVAAELTEENPTKFVRILGENLVLFRNKRGNVGILEERCPHRGASLSYGRVEERGLACAYHGWLFDASGQCLETPAEPAESKFHLSVKHKAYPVRKYVGFYWAYMGPDPAPMIPPLDIWERKDGRRGVVVYKVIDCNWLQSMENSVDPAHLQILHLDTTWSHKAPSRTRGYIDEVEQVDFEEVPYGIMKKRRFKDGREDNHPLIFPNNLRQANSTQFRVPIDDEHTWHVHVIFDPSETGAETTEEDLPVTYMEPFKEPPEGLHPQARFTMHKPLAQDTMTWETAGIIADRTEERLATSDRGIVMFREILKREINKVQLGIEPIGVFRNGHPIIDTSLDEILDPACKYPRRIWTLAGGIRQI